MKTLSLTEIIRASIYRRINTECDHKCCQICRVAALTCTVYLLGYIGTILIPLSSIKSRAQIHASTQLGSLAVVETSHGGKRPRINLVRTTDCSRPDSSKDESICTANFQALKAYGEAARD